MAPPTAVLDTGSRSVQELTEEVHALNLPVIDVATPTAAGPSTRAGQRAAGGNFAGSAEPWPAASSDKGSLIMHNNDEPGSTAVVTGAAGFIGSHLAEALLAQGYTVIGIDQRSPRTDPVAHANLQNAEGHPRFSCVNADLMDADLDSLVKDARYVFHLAAVPGVRSSWTGFPRYAAANILATERVLAACVRQGVPRLIYASSSSVYGVTGAPSRESEPTVPISPYGVSKLAGEQLCLAHAKRPGSRLSVIALRYFTVYGPRQRPDMAIGRVLAAALTGQQYTLFGDGTQRREFTYVKDVVEATMAAATADVSAAVVNVGGGSSVSMIDVLGMARQVVGQPVPLMVSATQDGDVPATAADLTLARVLLGYRPDTDLRTGMARHAEWLRRMSADQLNLYTPPPPAVEEVPACSS
ncbi:dTDP-glucose 4,6-dehydratase [Micromonospora sp. MH33]|nr:dTDP-glucose 4,6-dehydratase [Micromonospora sp. MH33]